MARTHILIINWNNAPDTIECIKSVVSFPDVNVLVIDNASSDNSLSEIRSFIENSNISYKEVTVAESAAINQCESPVLLVRSPVNSGFAGGNNALLRVSLQCRAEFAWLLNNDATADVQSLNALIAKAESDSTIVFVGSVILDHARPTLVQSCGVKYFPFFGVSKLIKKDAEWNAETKNSIPHDEIDFQHGASLFVRVPALKDIGLMDERYFLYFEEQDWQYAGREKGYKNVLAAESIVYHKGSVSTSNKKHLFFYYYNRSAILFSRKHSGLLVLLCATLMLTGITIIRSKGYFKSVAWGIKGIVEGYKKK
jgi:GT2 family glycosyltransferase